MLRKIFKSINMAFIIFLIKCGLRNENHENNNDIKKKIFIRE